MMEVFFYGFLFGGVGGFMLPAFLCSIAEPSKPAEPWRTTQ